MVLMTLDMTNVLIWTVTIPIAVMILLTIWTIVISRQNTKKDINELKKIVEIIFRNQEK